jgi:hypothetical protein
VDEKTKDMLVEMLDSYPEVISQRYHKLITSHNKGNRAYVHGAITLFHSSASLIGYFFIHEYMRSNERDKRASELIHHAVKWNTVQSWCDWLEFVAINQASYSAFEQGQFLSTLPDHHRKTYLWMGDSNERLVKIPCSLMEIMHHFELQLSDPAGITNAHRWIMRSVMRDFFQAIHPFMLNRFVEFTRRDKGLMIELLLGKQDWVSVILSLPHSAVFLARDESGYKLLPPIFLESNWAEQMIKESIEVAS